MPVTPDINSDDYYKVLGVERSSSEAEVAKAYKKMALKYHPDKNPDNKEQAEENFKKITEAYEVLHDGDKRKTYDQFGKAGISQGGGGGGPGGGVSFQHADQIFKAFFGGNDPFSMFFNEGDDNDPFASFAGKGGMPGGTRVVFGPGGGGMPGMGGMGGKGGMGGMGGMPFDIGGMMGGMGGMGGKGKSKPPQPQVPQHAMPIGTQVTVRDLEKAPQHNGKQGKIATWDSASGRYQVELKDGDQTLSLKPQNLTQVCSVEITGIDSQPELNGQQGTIESYMKDAGRYSVRLRSKMASGRDIIGVAGSNVILKPGTRVVTQGLSKEEFNGQMAQIKEFDRASLRYTVECQNGKTIKIKLDNVLC